MTTLKENIECKFEWNQSYDENKMCSIASEQMGVGPLNGAFKIGYVVGSKHQREQLKSEVLPILLDVVSALEEIKAYGHSELCQFMKPVRPSYRCTEEEATEALERLRKWSEG